MKRLFVLTMALFLVVGLIGCSGQKEKKEDNGIKVIPKPPKQELSVVSIDKLHGGHAHDISPDGQTLLFSWDMGQPASDKMAPATLLHTMNLADGSVKKLSHSEIHQGSARYSPDGKNIAFVENEKTFFQTYVMENKPDAPKKLIHKSDEIANFNSISWSPDGQTFAVSYFLINKGRIVLYDAQGNEKQSFQQPDGIAICPQFLDNHTLFYVAVDRANNTLKVMAQDVTASTNKPKELVAGANFEVSPDKRSLAYLVNDGDHSQWKMKVNAIDSNLKVGSTLTETSVKDSLAQMAWSPDSRYLLFGDGSNIWVINPKNGDKKQLVSEIGMIYNLFWINAEEIIFTGVAKEAEGKGDYNFNTYRIKLK
ncbi:hypothetical protein [Desulfotomaculum sp. 1211_IL3151]|uniref:hypothetical protein n=1 Tax=Desulfotomaculum sp. 1211_IL3151 TaxID=3084055 RepID=UPI002FD8AF31